MSALSSSRRFRITMFILFIAAVVLMSAIGMSFPAESTGIEQVANSRSTRNQIALSESIHQPEKISSTDTISETIIVPFKNGIHGVQTSRSLFGTSQCYSKRDRTSIWPTVVRCTSMFLSKKNYRL